MNPDVRSASIAIVVADEWQGKGIGARSAYAPWVMGTAAVGSSVLPDRSRLSQDPSAGGSRCRALTSTRRA
jgi:hypothetical protein